MVTNDISPPPARLQALSAGIFLLHRPQFRTGPLAVRSAVSENEEMGKSENGESSVSLPYTVIG
jgi:hypothetical protein